MTIDDAERLEEKSVWPVVLLIARTSMSGTPMPKASSPDENHVLSIVTTLVDRLATCRPDNVAGALTAALVVFCYGTQIPRCHNNKHYINATGLEPTISWSYCERATLCNTSHPHPIYMKLVGKGRLYERDI